MNKLRLLLALCVASMLLVKNAQADQSAPQVLASVYPLALMAASVVDAEQLDVLLPPGMTPHDFSMRPSDIQTLQNADIIIWAGPKAEPYLASFARRWPEKKWIDVSTFKTDNDPNDTHYWLSASMMTKAQAELAKHLKKDAGAFNADVNKAMERANTALSALRTRGFFVFHRAYDHWIQPLQLNQLGVFTISPEHKPGAKTIQRMRDQLNRGDVVCVFSEPEFSPTLVDSVVDDLPVKRGELDPMAAHIELNANGYVALIDDMTQRFVTCLTP